MIVIFPVQTNPAARGANLLLAHCAALDLDRGGRASARERLEALIGPDLARRLLRLSGAYRGRSSGRW